MNEHRYPLRSQETTSGVNYRFSAQHITTENQYIESIWTPSSLWKEKLQQSDYMFNLFQHAGYHIYQDNVKKYKRYTTCRKEQTYLVKKF